MVFLALLELREVSKVYRMGGTPVYALRQVSLAVEAGEFVAVLGRSGAGKSTLMNLLGCLDLPDTGTYLLAGEDVARMGEGQLARIRNRQIGFVFQGFNLIPTLTARESVELPLCYRGIGRRRREQLAAAALGEVGLADRLDHHPAQLSGGQQQRVAIARAIAAQPPILLADEPTGTLDCASGAGVMEILSRLHRQGRTVVLITHDPRVAACATRRVRILDGRVAGDNREGKP